MQSPEVQIVVSTQQADQPSSTINDLLQAVEKLPLDDRLVLLEKLLGKQTGLNVVFGNNQLSGNIIVQINTMDKEQLGELLKAIANRITSGT